MPTVEEHFNGKPDELRAAYDQLVALITPASKFVTNLRLLHTGPMDAGSSS
jgi:hypothetical protein